jgi:glycosyltransferase involved in cell wall biosynthesis
LAGATGVARYVTQLDGALVDAGVELHRYAFGRAPHSVPPGTRRLPVPLRLLRPLWRVVRLPRVEHLTGAVDVVLVTDLAPPPTRRPLVVTVHDLDAIDRPDLHDVRAQRLQHDQLDAARERADEVIAVSATTAAALAAHGVDAARISVVPHGATPLPPADRRLVPDGPYVLAVGTVDARKGLDVLIEGFARAHLDGAQLVIAGPDGHRADDARAAAAAHGIAERVTFPGRVGDAELAGLYEGALAYCLPSRAEGFGLPLLEAMGAGVAVVASDLPVVREVAGDVAVLVPVGDAAAWADALERLVADDAGRAARAAAGPGVAARYTWAAAAQATIAIYERLSP